jgi:hypothetical protein
MPRACAGVHREGDRVVVEEKRLRWPRLYVEPVKQDGAVIDAVVRDMSGEC